MSIPIVIHEEKRTLQESLGNIVFLVAGIIIVAGISLLNNQVLFTHMRIDHLNLLKIIYIFVSGVLVISAIFTWYFWVHITLDLRALYASHERS
jgi:hypothetical protein